MKKFTLNLTFKNEKDCRDWEDEHLIDNKYNGNTILYLAHCWNEKNGEFTLTDIVTC